MKFIVDFHNNTEQTDIDQYLSSHGCTVLKEWDNFDKVYLVESASAPPVTAITAFVKENDSLTIRPLLTPVINNYWAVANNPNLPSQEISTTDTKDWWKNYSLSSPVFDQPTTTISLKGQNVHVYIMDSGIESTHPEFEGVDISYLYTVTPNDYSDHRGHGTSLASVISGKTCGITNAKLKIVKIYENNHQTLQSEILDALDAILSDVPANHFALVNCSWVIDKNEWVEYKMREMTQRGIWVICAAGNNGTSIEDVTPASMPEAFTVGAYNQDLLPCDFSDYTGPLNTSQSHVNHGELDGWAPGENIYAALLNGSYGIISGTSIATAIMTAVGAYNFSDDLYADGAMNEVLRGIAPVGPDGAAARLCSRYDLLDLSDPKYQNSVNRIATYAREVQPTPPPDEFSTVAIAGQRKNLVKIFEPSLTKSFTFNTPVPANFYIMNSGLLYGEPTVEQGPDVNQSYVLHNLEATRVDINDVTEIIKIDLYVVRNNYQPADLPQDHAINITLAGQCSAPCGTWGCAACYLISNSPCNNDCSFACCDTGKSAMCNCVA